MFWWQSFWLGHCIIYKGQKSMGPCIWYYYIFNYNPQLAYMEKKVSTKVMSKRWKRILIRYALFVGATALTMIGTLCLANGKDFFGLLLLFPGLMTLVITQNMDYL